MAATDSHDVFREIHISLPEELRKIIDALNEQSHSLKTYDEIKIGDTFFREESGGQCKLRVACGMIINAGYLDTVKLV